MCLMGSDRQLTLPIRVHNSNNILREPVDSRSNIRCSRLNKKRKTYDIQRTINDVYNALQWNIKNIIHFLFIKSNDKNLYSYARLLYTVFTPSIWIYFTKVAGFREDIKNGQRKEKCLLIRCVGLPVKMNNINLT